MIEKDEIEETLNEAKTRFELIGDGNSPADQQIQQLAYGLLELTKAISLLNEKFHNKL